MTNRSGIDIVTCVLGVISHLTCDYSVQSVTQLIFLLAVVTIIIGTIVVASSFVLRTHDSTTTLSFVVMDVKVHPHLRHAWFLQLARVNP